MVKCKNCENEIIHSDKKGDEGWAHIIPTDESMCKNPTPQKDLLGGIRRW